MIQNFHPKIFISRVYYEIIKYIWTIRNLEFKTTLEISRSLTTYLVQNYLLKYC